MLGKPYVNIYEQSPDHYDSMVSNKLDKAIFNSIVREVKNCLKPGKTYILDLCCGTGILAKMLSDIPEIRFIGVDKNRAFLDSARKKTANDDNFKFILKDALRYESDSKFDIILLTSAYHHVENRFKTLLLKRAFDLLKADGAIIICEKIIRPYSDRREFVGSNREFYLKEIGYLKKAGGLNKKQLDAFMNVCSLSASAKDEYKVDYDYLIKDLSKTGFRLVKEIKVWPKKNLFGNEKVGDFVFVAKKRQ